MLNKRFKIENPNGLTENEIVNLFFKNENTIKDSECIWIYKCRLVEIKIVLKDGTKLNLMYDESIQYIDLTLNKYIGLGGFLINPYTNIISMEVDFR